MRCPTCARLIHRQIKSLDFRRKALSQTHMKIINALGGGGSTFIIRSLEKDNFRLDFPAFDPYRIKIGLEKYPRLIKPYTLCMRLLGGYQPIVAVLRRPDAFWTDWQFNKTGVYDPTAWDFPKALQAQMAYILNTRHLRSAGFSISPSQLEESSLHSLVLSYVEIMRAIELHSRTKIVLVSGHWGEYGTYKDLGLETIYLIRDPFNSLISHSKPDRHQKDYLRRGFKDINSKEWIDAYLMGPHHYWIKHAESALSHPNATIIRYNYFVEDWKQVSGLPDISLNYVYQHNEIARILTPESISYIQEQTRYLCAQLGFVNLI